MQIWRLGGGRASDLALSSPTPNAHLVHFEIDEGRLWERGREREREREGGWERESVCVCFLTPDVNKYWPGEHAKQVEDPGAQMQDLLRIRVIFLCLMVNPCSRWRFAVFCRTTYLKLKHIFRISSWCTTTSLKRLKEHSTWILNLAWIYNHPPSVFEKCPRAQ